MPRLVEGRGNSWGSRSKLGTRLARYPITPAVSGVFDKRTVARDTVVVNRLTWTDLGLRTIVLRKTRTFSQPVML